MKKIAVIALSIMMLNGCATMFSGSKDVLTINSNDPKATILVNGNAVGTGSAQYTLPRGKTAMITAEKKGCQSRTVETDKSMVGATWLNILFWPGFLVDMATGAMQKADPTTYSVTPDCNN